jgi:ATP-dependent DNA helicase DinG
MTSATLSVMGMRSGEHPKAEGVPSSSSDGMSYFVSKVGAEGLRTMQQGSPFDFQAQTKCYVVSKMPDPRHEDYRAALEKWIEHFVTMTSGGTFVLFTNLRLLQEVAESMLGFFESQSCTLYVQGSGLPRSTMLERFKKDRHAVLFGADSFWQGVDVPGDALRSVIITRLPFQVPDHPLVEARLERIAARGGDGFTESSLPEAILKFRQGVGRLIRTRQDQGVIAVLDNRVLVKRYGQRFLDALPEAPLQII